MSKAESPDPKVKVGDRVKVMRIFGGREQDTGITGTVYEVRRAEGAKNMYGYTYIAKLIDTVLSDPVHGNRDIPSATYNHMILRTIGSIEQNSVPK